MSKAEPREPMKIRSNSSRKGGTTIHLTPEGKGDSDTLLKLIQEMAKPTPPSAKKLPATTPTMEKDSTPEKPE